MRRKHGLVLLLLPLAFAAPTGWASDGRSAGTTVCVFPLADLSPSSQQGEYQKPFSEAVEQEFVSVGFTAIPRDVWAPEASRLSVAPDRITGGPQALRIAEAAGADMAVLGFYRREGDRILVSAQCYDVKAATVITGFTRTWRFNLGFYNSLHAEIADLVQRVIFSTAPRLIALSNEVRVDEIRFTSPLEGMEVVVQGAKSVGRIRDGSLVFQTGGVKAGTVLMIEKRLEGYHTLWQSVRAAPEIALTPLPRATVFAQELDWTGGQLEGAGTALRWYPVPDWIMLAFSEYLSTQIPLTDGGSWPLHADSELLVGSYLFFPPQSDFRLGISAGVGVVLTWIPGPPLPLFTDLYVNILNVWAEYNLNGLRMFLRVEGKVSLGVGNNLLGSNPLLWSNVLPPVTFGVVLPW